LGGPSPVVSESAAAGRTWTRSQAPPGAKLSMMPVQLFRSQVAGAVALALTVGAQAGVAVADDPMREMQADAVATRDEPRERPYHFGTQGPGSVFSNHASHTNRLVPVITLGHPV